MHWKRTEKAFRLHMEEAERTGATITNCGWGVNEGKAWISIASKTDQGILMSNVYFPNKKTIEQHVWRPYK